MFQDELDAIFASFSERFGARDVHGLTRYWTEDANLLPPDSPMVTGRPEIAGIVEQLWANGAESIELSTMKLTEAAGLVVVLGRFSLGFVLPDGRKASAPGHFTDVFQRQPDGSLLITLTQFGFDAPLSALLTP